MLAQRRTTTMHPTLHQLQAKCERLSVSRWFGCLNRNGLDEAIAGMDFGGLALVYADVDDLKTANERWGKAQSSARIAQALKMRSNDILFGQWFSGDEFAAFVPVDEAYAFALRLQENFKKVSMGVSICIAPITENTSIECLADQCDDRLTAVKKMSKGLVIYL
jgi:predicted signal transduction protein with EAL and GGDEF domain